MFRLQIMNSLFICIFLSYFSSLYSMQGTVLITAPGQNGMGTEYWYINQIFDTDIIPLHSDEGLNTISDAGTVEILPDLGQQKCINHFHKTIQAQLNNPLVNRIIVYAASQSTATVINWLAQQHKKKIDLSKIKMIILEAMLPSGNSAIYHTVKNTISSKLAAVPGAYYLLPYFAKCAFWHYQPAGIQAIRSIVDLPTVPVLFLHATKDSQCSYEDAKLFYGALKQSGKGDCYFMSFDEYAHIYLLNGKSESIQIFRKIILYEGFKDLDKEHEEDHFVLEQFLKSFVLIFIVYCFSKIANRIYLVK